MRRAWGLRLDDDQAQPPGPWLSYSQVLHKECHTLESSGASCFQNNSVSVGRGLLFSLSPRRKKAQGSGARRGCVLNRCFEALRRADGSQALKTATGTQAWPLSTLPTHGLRLFVGGGTRGFGWQVRDLTGCDSQWSGSRVLGSLFLAFWVAFPGLGRVLYSATGR